MIVAQCDTWKKWAIGWTIVACNINAAMTVAAKRCTLWSRLAKMDARRREKAHHVEGVRL